MTAPIAWPLERAHAERKRRMTAIRLCKTEPTDRVMYGRHDSRKQSRATCHTAKSDCNHSASPLPSVTIAACETTSLAGDVRL